MGSKYWIRRWWVPYLHSFLLCLLMNLPPFPQFMPNGLQNWSSTLSSLDSSEDIRVSSRSSGIIVSLGFVMCYLYFSWGSAVNAFQGMFFWYWTSLFWPYPRIFFLPQKPLGTSKYKEAKRLFNPTIIRVEMKKKLKIKSLVSLKGKN